MVATYKCSQQELYTVCRLAWSSCNDYLSIFNDFKTSYTPQLVQQKLQEINAAAILPDVQARNAKSEILRIELVMLLPQCLQDFNILKRYIVSAYSSLLQKANIDAAGQKYYSKAAAFNWESVQGLLQNAISFVVHNDVALSVNNNMPATFLGRLQQKQTEFNRLYQAFLSAITDEQLATEQKIVANNGIYASLINMLADGQVLFSHQAAICKQFIFTYLIGLVSGVGTAGLKGYVTDAVTGRQINGAQIVLLNKDKTAVTDNEGHYEINQVAAGEYTVIVKADGYVDFVKENHEVKVGTVSSLHVALVREE